MNAKDKPCHTIGIRGVFLLLSVVLLSRVCLCVHLNDAYYRRANERSKIETVLLFFFLSNFFLIPCVSALVYLAFNSIDKISSFDTNRRATCNLFLEHKTCSPFLSFQLSCVSDQQDISHLLVYDIRTFRLLTRNV